jgi:peptidylprolyl isomerase
MHCRIIIFLILLLPGAFATSARAAEEITWREVSPKNLVYMELREGLVIIELNALFAPKTVSQFRKLVAERFYNGLSFYRVIDGFVAQGGDGSDLGEVSNVPLIDAEFEIEWPEDLPFTPVQENDLFAAQTGFVDGFAAAHDADKEQLWLTHCPGVVAMARNDSPGSSRTDFYIVIGQAPRYLDRNMNIFGRVVYGMDVVQRIQRGEAEDNGVILDETASSRIRSMRLGTDIPEDEALRVYVMNTEDRAFEKMLDERRKRKQKFFHQQPPKVLDVCQVPMAGRVTR